MRAVRRGPHSIDAVVSNSVVDDAVKSASTFVP